MQQKDLRQISDLMDRKFKKNNKKLKEDIVNEVGAITNQSFGEFEKKTGERFDKMDKRFDKMENELKKKPDRDEMFKWADDKIIPLQLDMDKTKYIHIDKWKKLPAAYEIRKALVDKRLI